MRGLARFCVQVPASPPSTDRAGRGEKRSTFKFGMRGEIESGDGGCGMGVSPMRETGEHGRDARATGEREPAGRR